jgi:dTDP-4-amino-4,6-dideoxygalactose transaminase
MHSVWETVDHFEDIIANYAGAKYAVATDCCTHSLFLSLKYLNASGIITIPNRTYVSVPAACINAGCSVQFRDAKWTGVYKLTPYPIVDCAVRFTQNMYTPGHLQCLSFGYKKPIPIGKGGMILTDDKEAMIWLKKARFAGRDTLKYNDIKDITVLGWMMNMTPEQAARGVELFYRLPKHNDDFASYADYAIDLSQLTAFK